mgnify:CR=1 FL=1
MDRYVRILGTGRYLPKRAVTAADLDAKLGLKPGAVEAKSGVLTRYFAGPTETASFMGARAAQQALDDALDRAAAMLAHAQADRAARMPAIVAMAAQDSAARRHKNRRRSSVVMAR